MVTPNDLGLFRDLLPLGAWSGASVFTDPLEEPSSSEAKPFLNQDLLKDSIGVTSQFSLLFDPDFTPSEGEQPQGEAAEPQTSLAPPFSHDPLASAEQSTILVGALTAGILPGTPGETNAPFGVVSSGFNRIDSTFTPPPRMSSIDSDVQNPSASILLQALQGSVEALPAGAVLVSPTVPVSDLPPTTNEPQPLNDFRTVNEIDPLDPPNQNPVAVNDTATVDEDSSVSISVLANDSDADGDNLDVWLADAATPHGKVLYDSGQVLYTPDPDYYGTDTFSYTVIDGSGGAATGTVTVTVQPYNDVPLAFNDGYSWTIFDSDNDGDIPDPNNDPLVVSAQSGVLANDIDYEDPPPYPGALTAHLDLGLPPEEGTLSLAADGSFTFTPDESFEGVTSFTYYTTDSEDAVSNFATVRLIIIRPSDDMPPTEEFQANPDSYPVGEDPLSAFGFEGVMANDVNGSFVVLNAGSHPDPNTGKLTAFDFDGSFQFAPGYDFYGETPTLISYTAFNTRGARQQTTVTLYPVFFDLYNGQSGKKVKLKIRETPGAFTVANLNDTNGNGTVDKDENEVKKGANSPAGSSDEVDLMEISLWPNDPLHGPNDKVKLTIGGLLPPAVMLWKKPTKGVGEEVALTNGSAEFTFAELGPLYIEVLQPSGVVGDLDITMEYKGKTYSAKATAIWAWRTSFRNSGNALSANADGRDINRNFFTAQGGKLGLVGANTGAPRTSNGMEMEFQVVPQNVGKEPGIVFDVSRSKEGKVWLTNAGNRVLTESPSYNSFRDNPNDDNEPTDEDNEPTNNFIYSIDFPGAPSNQAIAARLEQRGNFLEFVRVKIHDGPFVQVQGNGTDANPKVQGSRASNFIEWHTRLDVVNNNGMWARNNTPGENEIDLGLKDLGN